MDKKMRQKNNGNGSLSSQSSSRLQKSDGGGELRPAEENGSIQKDIRGIRLDIFAEDVE